MNKILSSIFMIGALSVTMLFGEGQKSPQPKPFGIIFGKSITKEEYMFMLKKVDIITAYKHSAGSNISRNKSRTLRLMTIERFILLAVAEKENLPPFPADKFKKILISENVFKSSSSAQGEEPTFSRERYLRVLEGWGFTEASYYRMEEENWLLQQLQNKISQTDLVTKAVVRKEFIDQTRRHIIAVKSFRNQDFPVPMPTKAEVEQWFKDNTSKLAKTPEKRSAKYIKLDFPKYSDNTEVSCKVLEDYYNLNSKFFHDGEYSASHIIITATPKDPRIVLASARQKIDDVWQRLENGESFEELVVKYSKGPSVKSSGNLGWKFPGKLDSNFEKNVLALKPGSYSKPFQTKFGYHIARLNSPIRTFDNSFKWVKQVWLKNYHHKLHRQKVFELSNKLHIILRDRGIADALQIFVKFAQQHGLEVGSIKPVSMAKYSGQLPNVSAANALFKLTHKQPNSSPIRAEDDYYIFCLESIIAEKTINLTEKVYRQIEAKLLNERRAQESKKAATVVQTKLKKLIASGITLESSLKQLDFRTLDSFSARGHAVGSILTRDATRSTIDRGIKINETFPVNIGDIGSEVIAYVKYVDLPESMYEESRLPIAKMLYRKIVQKKWKEYKLDKMKSAKPTGF